MIAERRRSQRTVVSRIAKIQLATGSLPRDCLITEISDHGARLHVEGIEVPDHFVLLLSLDARPQARTCHVVWRLGFELGIQFLERSNRPVAR